MRFTRICEDPDVKNVVATFMAPKLLKLKIMDMIEETRIQPAQSKKSMLTTIGIGIAILLFGLFVYIIFAPADGSDGSRGRSMVDGVFAIGKTIPVFKTIDFDGNTVSSTQFVGKPVVLDFWAAWCATCQDEMLELERIYQAYGDDVYIVGIHRTDTGETINRAKQFADEQGVSYLLLQDPSGDIYKAVAKGLTSMPVTVFIDKDGIVQNIEFGSKTIENIQKEISKLLN